MEIFLLDNLNNTQEELNIIKPRTYKELLEKLRLKLKNLPQNFDLFIFDKNNKEVIINNEKKYKLIEKILFIRMKYNTDQSIFQINYNKLSQSKKEILDQKYNCILCTDAIKNENPYLCYKCQKIYHEKCIKHWDKQCKINRKKFCCPCCRDELPLKKWSKKLDYNENRSENANLMNKINELKDYNKKAKEIFKNIIDKINIIHSLLKLENDINLFQLNFDNLDEISNVINEELAQFIYYIKNKINIKSVINDNMIINKDITIDLNLIENEEDKKDQSIIDNNPLNNGIDFTEYNIKNRYAMIEENEENLNKINNSINNDININTNNIQINEYINTINLKYFTNSDGDYNIFGEEFVKNNKDNIDLKINNQQSALVSKCKLEEGENSITLLIKNQLTNLSYMFSFSQCIKEIKELKYLDVKNVKNLSYMFRDCLFLLNINPLESWDVSNCTNFSYMFYNCSSLVDIKPLENWNVSKGTDFSFMFDNCSSILNLNGLQNWKITNGKNFSDMFHNCVLLTDINGLTSWNITNNINFQNMFRNCSSLTNLKGLEKWNVSNGTDFSYMFYDCSSLKDIKSLKNWNVSKGTNFSYMFYNCSKLADINPIKNWKVSNGFNFKNMFFNCSKSINIKIIKSNWQVPL